MTTQTQKAALDALYELEDNEYWRRGDFSKSHEVLRAFILAHPDAAPEKVEGMEEALTRYEQDGILYDDDDHNDRMIEPLYKAARLYSQGRGPKNDMVLVPRTATKEIVQVMRDYEYGRRHGNPYEAWRDMIATIVTDAAPKNIKEKYLYLPHNIAPSDKERVKYLANTLGSLWAFYHTAVNEWAKQNNFEVLSLAAPSTALDFTGVKVRHPDGTVGIHAPCQEMIAALSTPQQAAPDGWKLVPIEPTEEMYVAFGESWFSDRRCIDDFGHDWYDALLAAAPDAQKGGE